MEVFGNPKETERWLKAPNKALSGNSPASLCRTEAGAIQVRRVLHAVKWEGACKWCRVFSFLEADMTLPHERTRAVAQTYEFLRKLARNSNLPEEVRRDALDLLRHFPNQYDVTKAGANEERLSEVPHLFIDPVFSSSCV
ncbi:MbcA/ParS/Xre antitoxin family protein [Stutzerimonas kunmingensis]|uniref:MbcA/ParS/Xre antitoxin family protein n=1 Tax=Stutzerimonas kunmingensis TaxID=1211807 RepID=UPI003AF9A785